MFWRFEVLTHHFDETLECFARIALNCSNYVGSKDDPFYSWTNAFQFSAGRQLQRPSTSVPASRRRGGLSRTPSRDAAPPPTGSRPSRGDTTRHYHHILTRRIGTAEAGSPLKAQKVQRITFQKAFVLLKVFWTENSKRKHSGGVEKVFKKVAQCRETQSDPFSTVYPCFMVLDIFLSAVYDVKLKKKLIVCFFLH